MSSKHVECVNVRFYLRLRILLFFILIFTLLVLKQLYAQNYDVTLKAAYIERFTRFIQWPAENFNQETDTVFTVLILGKNPFGDVLEVLYSTINIKEKKVRVIASNNIELIKDCQLVYVSSSLEKRLEEVLEQTRKYSVLSVSDTPGFCDKGVLINFIPREDVLRFEINVKEFKKSKLKVSHLLLNIAENRN